MNKKIDTVKRLVEFARAGSAPFSWDSRPPYRGTWISIEERNPTIPGLYPVKGLGGYGIHVPKPYEGKSYWEDGIWQTSEQVTHWKEIPQ